MQWSWTEQQVSRLCVWRGWGRARRPGWLVLSGRKRAVGQEGWGVGRSWRVRCLEFIPSVVGAIGGLPSSSWNVHSCFCVNGLGAKRCSGKTSQQDRTLQESRWEMLLPETERRSGDRGREMSVKVELAELAEGVSGLTKVFFCFFCFWFFFGNYI